MGFCVRCSVLSSYDWPSSCFYDWMTQIHLSSLWERLLEETSLEKHNHKAITFPLIYSKEDIRLLLDVFFLFFFAVSWKKRRRRQELVFRKHSTQSETDSFLTGLGGGGGKSCCETWSDIQFLDLNGQMLKSLWLEHYCSDYYVSSMLLYICLATVFLTLPDGV